MKVLEGPRLRLRRCPNARDLGGLPAAGGRRTRLGSVVRSGTLERLGRDGWEALAARGIRTVIDLRNPDERGGDAAPRPAAMSTVHIPLDGVEHADFWREWSSGPERGTSAREALLATLSTLDPEERLRAGGLGEHDIAALRERMLEPGAAGG